MKLLKAAGFGALCWIPIVIVTAVDNVYELNTFFISVPLVAFWCGMVYNEYLNRRFK